MQAHPFNQLIVQEPVHLQNLTIFPLILSQAQGPAYVTLAEAIGQHGLVVTEVDEGGSVPDLLVVNPSDLMVLLLDGEELRGAKQNRVINTTLLLAPRSRTRIPVSCTERGRWHYTSEHFSPGNTVMPSKARRRKVRSVTESLQAGTQFMSSQQDVWQDVDELHVKLGSHSPTSAMADAYGKVHRELEEAAAAVPALDGQCGLVAMINGAPAGLDTVSMPDAYRKLHLQLLQSYAMEALTSRQLGPTGTPGQPGPQPASPEQLQPDVAAAKAFLERCAAIPGKPYPSVALGTDWRFVSDTLVGSGLEVQATWIHMAYFVDDGGSAATRDHPRMARMSRRSSYRREQGPQGG
jgi:hypothetical protein